MEKSHTAESKNVLGKKERQGGEKGIREEWLPQDQWMQEWKHS